MSIFRVPGSQIGARCVTPGESIPVKLFAVWAVQIGFVVGLPVTPSAHEKEVAMFHVLTETTQHSAWQWRWWRWRGLFWLCENLFLL